jgi:uncharacterized membrane protein YbhN (UPF0104 family)
VRWEAVTVRSLALRALLLAVLFAAVALLLGRIVPGAGARLRNADAGWLVLGVGCEVMACGGYAALFHAVFARRPAPISGRRSMQIALAELGGFAVVPAGLGGPAARVWGLRRAGMSWRTLGVRTVTHAPIFNAPYVGAALVLGLAAVVGAGPGRASLTLALAPAGVVLAALSAFALVTLAGRLRWLDRESGWRRTAREVLAVVPDGIRETPAVVRDPRAVAGSVAFWAGDCAVLWAAFNAVGVVPPVGVIVLAYMLGQLGNALPLPGGVGGVEPVMLSVLAASGVDSGAGAAAIVCYRAISLGVQAALGAIAFATLAPEIGAPQGPTSS